MTQTREHHSEGIEHLAEVVQHGIQGDDEPMEEAHPRAPGVLVGYCYPLALVVVLFIVLLVMMLY